MKRTWMFAGLGVAAIAAVAVGAATIIPSATASGPATSVGNTAFSGPIARTVTLSAMPVGSVKFVRQHGDLAVSVHVTGLTPSSWHTVRLVVPGNPNPLTAFDNLQAKATGAATVTLTSSYSQRLPRGTQLQLTEGVANIFGQHNPLAATPVAQTVALPHDPVGDSFTLHALDIAADGANEGRLTGTATVFFNPQTHNVTVYVNASGLTPGYHADHIHVGSCTNQDAPVVMLPDLKADAYGNVRATVTKGGVTSAMLKSLPAKGFYLNIHQGDMNTILANGAPTLQFRPLLCGNI